MICIPHQILHYQIKNNDMSGVSGMYGRQESYIQGFGGKT
jgi:hypothetical protein